MGRLARVTTALAAMVLVPVLVFGQASITGVVSDTSGAVMPGVTVDAASPALIEKVRSVVTDGAGQYRIVDLRPGIYSVTFTLPGFSTILREGIELQGTFTATVNAELRVGALEETITVSGETPVVDVQSAQQQQIATREVIAALPTGRAFLSLVTLNPSVVMSDQDVGGTTGPNSARYTAHGSMVTDSRILVDGLGVASADQGGASGTYYVPNVTASQEQVVTTSSGGLSERDAGGVVVNLIPRDGGNTTSGTFFGTGASRGMQSDNYTQELKDRGLRAPNRMARNWDVTGALGGPLLKDKLWYFGSARNMVADNYIAGLFYNRNAGDPSSWSYDPDRSRQGIFDGAWRSFAGRLTAQVTPRNKFTAFWDEQRRCVGCPGAANLVAAATQAPEAGTYGLSFNDRVSQATWTSPFTNRLLFEAGFGTHILSWGGLPGDMAYQVLVPVTEQGGIIPGLTYRGISGNFRRGNQTYNWRSSASYVSGAHNAKFGYQGSFYGYRAQSYSLNGGLRFRFNNGVPNQVTETVEDYTWQANMGNHSLYAQDKWTVQRLTLQGGVRYDRFQSSFPASQLGPTALVPIPIVFPASTGASFNDIAPRLSAAYDLFGDGKTAVNLHIDKYMVSQESSANGTFGSFMHPINRLAVSANRSWNDANRNFVPDCDLTNRATNGECGPMDNQNFGREVFSVTYDPAMTSGWGVRPYAWEFGASVQRELLSRVSATFGYYRRWYGNFAVTDNLATSATDYTLFNLPVPADSRLPMNGGALTVATVNPDKFGQVRNQVTAASNFGTQIERWHGIDFALNARPRNGLTVQGGVSTGRTLRDSCEVAAQLPESLGAFPIDFCRQEQPFQTQLKGFAAYTIPRVDVQVSGTWQNVPGPAILAVYNAPNAVIAPVLGRNLAGNAANQAVNLLNYIPPGPGGSNLPVSQVGERLNQIDFRVAKLLKFGRTRTLVGVDVFNATNSSAVRSVNTTYGPQWLTPTQILQPRFAKISAQFDF